MGFTRDPFAKSITPYEQVRDAASLSKVQVLVESKRPGAREAHRGL